MAIELVLIVVISTQYIKSCRSEIKQTSKCSGDKLGQVSSLFDVFLVSGPFTEIP